MKFSRFDGKYSRAGFFALILVAGLAALSSAAQANNLVVNGDFEQLSVPGASAEFGDRFPSQQVTGWATGGYNYVFTPNTADTTGANGEYGKLYLWGPNNGSNNGFTSTSPAGGNFLAMDGAYAQAPVTQTINGLAPGVATTVSFYFAGIQQQGFSGPTTEQFQVSLGNSIQFTPVLTNADHGFTGWTKQVFTFIPTSSSEVLSFLAIGTPAGVPPFSLLDGVSVSNSPEPATLGLLGVSLAVFGGAAFARRRAKRVSQADTE